MQDLWEVKPERCMWLRLPTYTAERIGAARVANSGQNDRTRFGTLDDFTPELERRRAEARLTLDDFAKGWNGT